MKLALLAAFLALPLAAQFRITVARIGDELPKYLVGAVPVTIRAYSSLTCNIGPTPAELSPDLVIQTIMAKGFAVQPGQDVVDAVRAYKGGKGRVVAYNFGLAGMHLVPALSFLAGPVQDRRDQLRNFNPPENWWVAGKNSVPLSSGRCLELKFAVYGDAPTPEPMILGALGVAGIGGSAPGVGAAPERFQFFETSACPSPGMVFPDPCAVTISPAWENCGCTSGSGQPTICSCSSPSNISRTHSQTPDPEDEHLALVEQKTREATERRELMERITGIGASN